MNFPFFKSKPKTAVRGQLGKNLMRSVPVLPKDAQLLRDVGGKIMRMYDAALTNNLNADFPISLTSGNAEIQSSFIGVRSRAQKLERDNPYAKSIINSLMKNIGGHDPFRFESKVGAVDAKGKFVEEKETNRKIEEWWKKCALPENCTVRRNMSRQELYLQAVAAMVRDGGVIGRHRNAFDNEMAYAVQAVDIARLDENYQRPKTDGNNEIQFGIEQDEYGAPLFYHLWTRNPGDIYAYSNQSRFREKVPAKDIIALFDIRTRPEQMIQVSRFSSIIQRLHREEQFDVAHVTAALLACCKSIWITKQFPSAQDFVPDAIRERVEQFVNDDIGMGAANGQGAPQVNMTPGEMNQLEWGQDIKAIDMKFPNEAAPAFKKEQLRAASAGSGVPYYEVGQDLEGVNFSSGRLGREDFHEECKISQIHFILNYARPHFCAALKNALLFGKLDLPFRRYQDFVDGARFYGKRWGYINPLQDVQADILTIEAGLTSRSQVIAESDRGGDVEEVDAEIQSDREIDKAHDVDFSAADVTKPSISKGLPGEDVANPLASVTPAAPKTTEGKTPMKAKRGVAKMKIKRSVNYEKLEQTLRILHETDPEFAKNGEYDEFIKFKKARNGSLTKHEP